MDIETTTMGSIPKLSVLRGECHPLPHPEKESHLLHRLFEQGLSKVGPDTLAILAEDKDLTYSELDTLTSSLGRSILRRAHTIGAKSNSDGDFVVAVCMAPSERLVATLMATWKAGAAYLPLDPSFPPGRITHILNEAQPIIVITDEEDSEVHALSNIAVSYRELVKEAKNLSGSPISDEDTLAGRATSLALVLYTSGSTGVPKGVRIPHQVVLNRLRWQWRVFPYSPQECVCVFKTALTFVDSVSELWGPLLQGRTVLVVKKHITVDPERLVRLLDHHKVERLVLVPSLLRSILLYLSMEDSSRSGDIRPLRHLKIWVCSGEPLATELATKFFDRFPPGSHVLCNFYGSTEVMGDVTYHVLGDAISKAEKIPIGRPLDNTVVYLMDRDFHPVASGEVGELFVSGLNLAQGYVSGRDPDRFVTNPLAIGPDFARLYRTGDYARIENGTLIYEGRTDSQVKVRGHRVDLSEVEKALNDVKGVDKGVVLCYKPGEVNQTLLGFVMTDNNSTSAQVEAILQRNLAPYQMPQVIVLDKIPLLVNGKTDRQTLLKSYDENYNNESGDGGEKVELDYSGISNKDISAAQTLFETIASVLGKSARSKLNISSNFYELGGNSLNSIYTVTKLRDQGYVIGISEFISSKDLSEVLKRMRSDDENEQDAILRCSVESSGQYSATELRDSDKEEAANMVTDSFYEKADLEQWLAPNVHREDYIDLIDKIWTPLLQNKLCFMVTNIKGEIVGVSLNCDICEEPDMEVEVTSCLSVVFNFLEHIERPIRERQLPQGTGKVLYSFMMATHKSLSPQQNIEIMQFMEEQVMRIAKENRFLGVFTTNTSPLTQQLGEDVYGYQALLDYQVNRYTAPDGTKPFGQAPDDQRAVCSWKPIHPSH